VFIVIQKTNSNKVFLSYLILLIIDLGFENEQAIMSILHKYTILQSKVQQLRNL
jgi:hypothetical protein